MIKLAAAIATIFAQSAFADSWSDFQSRCLLPMERVAPFDLAGLTLAESPDDNTIYDLGPDASLVVGQDPQSCELRTADFGSAPLEWAEQVMSEGRYVDVPPILAQGPLLLQSTEWREPRMEVLIDWVTSGEVQTVTVTETNLES